MQVFPVPSGMFAGMTQAQLLDLRAKFQAALVGQVLGQRTVSASYTQGNGAKSVTFGATSKAEIEEMLRRINGALGVSGRRAMRVVFG